MIVISSSAAREIKRLQQSRQINDSLVYLGVKSGGCSGLIYSLDFISRASHTTEQVMEVNGIALMVEPKSITYLEGLKLDYSEDLMGGGFRFTNPNAVTNCSCGQSFKVE